MPGILISASHHEGDPTTPPFWVFTQDERALKRRFATRSRQESLAIADLIAVAGWKVDCPAFCSIADHEVTVWIPATDAGWALIWEVSAHRWDEGAEPADEET